MDLRMILYCAAIQSLPTSEAGHTMGTPPLSSSEHMDVKYIAHLARIHLTEEEVASFQSQLDDVLAYVDQLKALDVSDIEPTAHAIPVRNVLRDDEVRPSLDHATVMRNAPSEVQGQFKVPRIVE